MAEENILIGNVVLYGATSEAFFRGVRWRTFRSEIQARRRWSKELPPRLE
jgi:hypothetical protein